MQKLKKSVFINASRQKVWDAVTGFETYKEWTKPFNATSYFKGDWSEGSKMYFLGTDESGKEGGMVSRIAKSVPGEFLSIEHLGMFENGVEDTTSEKVKAWSPSFENYTLNEKDGGTEFLVEVDLPESYVAEFDSMWDNSLKVLKEVAER
jgi:uncharacterized protein YndB with AHSA1/START domain